MNSWTSIACIVARRLGNTSKVFPRLRNALADGDHYIILEQGYPKSQ